MPDTYAHRLAAGIQAASEMTRRLHAHLDHPGPGPLAFQFDTELADLCERLDVADVLAGLAFLAAMACEATGDFHTTLKAITLIADIESTPSSWRAELEASEVGLLFDWARS